jgi:hypothetical protein
VTNVAWVFAVTSASATVSPGTFAVKSDDIVNAPLSPYLDAVPGEVSRGLQLLPVAGDRRIDLRDAGASGWLTSFCRPARGSACRRGPSSWTARHRSAPACRSPDVDIVSCDVEDTNIADRVVAAFQVASRDVEAADPRRLQRDRGVGLRRCRA